MRSISGRAAFIATVMLALSACNVSDADIEHWKHTQRGPRKITTVLIESRYEQSMRVHAARALIEMKHPNANGLELLQTALQSMSASDREPIVHALVSELQGMMTAQGTASAQGPTEAMIKAKDAAYVLIRGDGRNSFASAEDRTALANAVLDWELADLNSRALAGSYTAEQVVQAIGSSSVERLNRAIQFTEPGVPVIVEVAKLVNGIANPAGKQSTVARIVAVAQEIESAQATPRLKDIARRMLVTVNRPTDEATLTRTAEQLRTQYLTVVFEGIRTLAQSNGTDYLLSVASNPSTPLERKKTALTAMANTVSSAHTERLLTIVACGQAAAAPPPRAPTPAPAAPTGACDTELRGIAVDRVGETRDRAVIPRLFALFDTSNGGQADQGFILRWKLGEAVLKLGGAQIIPEFMQHLGAQRAADFRGYTFAELNGEAQALGDLTPPPRDTMRGYLANNHPVPVRLLAMMFLGIKGEQRDLAALQGFANEATPVTGEGWNEMTPPLTTVGAVATRTRQSLEQTLRQGQQTAPGRTP
jgi:hypothetical protein